MMKYTAAQEEALTTINQNLQIIACAGSGKTQVISQRISNILKQPGVLPKHVIAFTYTEKAAAELKSRVLKICKVDHPEIKGMVDMYVGTIHAWCLKVLQEHVYEYQKFSVLDEIKLKLFVDRNYKDIGMDDLQMERYKHTELFVKLMGMLREVRLTVPKDELPTNIIQAWQNYESKLKSYSYFDFTMIMTLAFEHLSKDESFRKKIGEVKYLIVDEYQDVNPIQEKLISTIQSLGCNICIVGDDDQTIYQWRGGDINYILDFATRYPSVKKITLADNFRSSLGIVDIASDVIKNNAKRLPKDMIAKSDQKYQDGDILFNNYNTVDEENEFITQQIEKLHGIKFNDKGKDRGLDYSDFTILLRKWKKADQLIQVLEKHDIPFIVAGVNELFRMREVRASIQIFQYLSEDIDSSVLIESWSDLSPKIENDKLLEAIEYLNTKKSHRVKFYFDLVLQDIFLTFLQKAGITEETFQIPGKKSRAGNEHKEIVFYNLGMFSQVINDFETIHFVSEPKRKVKDFLNFIRYGADQVYGEGWLNNNFRTPNAVQIMTIHQSKGLEFPVVFIPGMNKNYLPAQGIGGKKIWDWLPKTFVENWQRYERTKDDYSDERRLFYVALTRSQKFLFVSRAPGSANEQKPSDFIKEFSHSSHIFESKGRDYKLDKDRKWMTASPKSDHNTILLNFSVLKNYFECPYMFKLISLYGFQFPLSHRIGYGRSMHNMLMEIHKRAIEEGKVYSPSDIADLVKIHGHFPYAYEDLKATMQKKTGDAVLEYLNINQKDFNKIEFAEKEIQIDLGDGVMINGRVDLIKKMDQSSGEEKITIVDFKSAEDVQTVNITMEQLSLYAIGYQELSGKTPNFLQIYNMDDNTPKTREIQNADLDGMKKRIIISAEEIRRNNFTKTTDNKTCQSCRRNMICSGCTI